MNNRVNGEGAELISDFAYQIMLILGVLAVTRSLGDASMKEFVVGSPYTTETNLDEQDDFLIVACDGVSAAAFGLQRETVLTLSNPSANTTWDGLNPVDPSNSGPSNSANVNQLSAGQKGGAIAGGVVRIFTL